VCALWTPAFTRFLHNFMDQERGGMSGDSGVNARQGSFGQIDAQGDLPMGAVIKAAVERGLRVYGRMFPDETYIDIGTPKNLLEASRAALPAS
jgi:glucose-1-phosphate thymidylyltransferase